MVNYYTADLHFCLCTNKIFSWYGSFRVFPLTNWSQIVKSLSHQFWLIFEPHCEKTKVQISCGVTAQPISGFVFVTQIVQFLYFLNQKFQAPSLLLCLYSSVCVRPGWKPRTLIFSRCGSIDLSLPVSINIWRMLLNTPNI